MSASISRRSFIQWLPDEPSEQTSTLVLTTSGGRFVDIRILKEALLNGHAGTSQTLDQIDWAFSGTSRSTKVDTTARSIVPDLDNTLYSRFAPDATNVSKHQEAPSRSHTVWTHTIDSRVQSTDNVTDEGDMEYDAALGLTIETGRMAHPETGKLTEYVEGWTDEDILPVSGTLSSAVLEMNNPELHARGLMIKLGQYMQGVARFGEHFSLVRLSWTEASNWQLDASVGSMDFPTQAILQQGLNVGDSFDLRTPSSNVWKWTVTEIE